MIFKLLDVKRNMDISADDVKDNNDYDVDSFSLSSSLASSLPGDTTATLEDH